MKKRIMIIILVVVVITISSIYFSTVGIIAIMQGIPIVLL